MTSSTQDLADLCRSAAAQLRAGNDRNHAYIRHEADRLDHVARWLNERDHLPIDPHEWPCVSCDAEPGGSCFDDRTTSHYGRGFAISITQPGDRVDGVELAGSANPAETCRPTVESGPAQSYRARCLGCGERGPIRTGENAASEDAQDHAFPTWRELPAVPRPPTEESPQARAKALRRWRAQVDRMLPRGWIDRGGPIRTYRQPHGTRHVPGAAPGGGYDMSAGIDPTRRTSTPVAESRPVEAVPAGEQFVLDLGL